MSLLSEAENFANNIAEQARNAGVSLENYVKANANAISSGFEAATHINLPTSQTSVPVVIPQSVFQYHPYPTYTSTPVQQPQGYGQPIVLGENIGQEWQNIKNYLSNNLEQPLINNLSNNWNDIKSVLNTSLSGLTNSLKTNYQDIASGLNQESSLIQNSLSNGFYNLSQSFNSSVNDLNSSISNSFYNLKGDFNKVISGFKTDITGLTKEVVSGYDNLKTTLGNDLTSSFKDISAGFNELSKPLIGFESSLVNNLEGLGKTIERGFFNMENKNSNPPLDIKALADSFIEFFKNI